MRPGGQTTMRIYKRLWLQARPYWPHIAGIFLLDLLATPLALLKPFPLKIAVDNVIGTSALPKVLNVLLPVSIKSSRMSLLLVAAALEVLIIFVVQMHYLLSYWFRTQIGEKLTLDFRARIFHHLQRLSLSFHDRKGTADSIYRIQDDAPCIQWTMIYGFLPFISDLTMLVTMFYVTVRIDWQLALVALAVSPFLFWYARIYDKRVGGRYHSVKEMESSGLQVVQETLAALRVVKAFGREDAEQDRFLRRSADGLRARVRLAFAEGAFGLIVNVTIAAGTGLVLYVGIRDVEAGKVTLGNLLVVLAYLTQLYGPLETISQQAASMQAYVASAHRVFELLDQIPEVPETSHPRPLKRAAGKIEFCNVGFDYGDGHEVLREVSFTVPAGTRVGIFGRTGAGKTTLISLMARFYDPTSGRILLDGTDLRDYRLAELRAQFGVVFQESVLFSASIAENIAYARPHATEQEILAAAKAANAHDFITSLPEGYKTQVGERGAMLSGGERQRIALARAFLKSAPILILDEPTSAVDVKTEAEIIEAMERLMRGRTCFVISHRPAALEHCDMLLRVNHGPPAEVTPEVAAIATQKFAYETRLQS